MFGQCPLWWPPFFLFLSLPDLFFSRREANDEERESVVCRQQHLPLSLWQSACRTKLRYTKGVKVEKKVSVWRLANFLASGFPPIVGLCRIGVGGREKRKIPVSIRRRRRRPSNIEERRRRWKKKLLSFFFREKKTFLRREKEKRRWEEEGEKVRDGKVSRLLLTRSWYSLSSFPLNSNASPPLFPPSSWGQPRGTNSSFFLFLQSPFGPFTWAGEVRNLSLFFSMD